MTRKLLAKTLAEPAYACASAVSAIDLDPRTPIRILNQQPCLSSTVTRGPLLVTGCLREVVAAEQIPEAERRTIVELLRQRFGGAAIGATDTWIADGGVRVNGVVITPAEGAAVVLSVQLDSIVSADARIAAGGIQLGTRRDFRIDIAGAGERLPLGRFARAGGLSVLGGLGLDGDVSVDLVGGPNLTQHAELSTHLVLPPWLGGFKAAATVRVTRSGLLELDSASIGPIGFGIPPLRIQDLKIAYRGGAWYGQIRLCVAVDLCIDATPEKGGGVQIGPGEFFSVAANLTFPGRGLPLFSEVYLRSIHAGVSHPPLRLIGGVHVTAAGLIELNGTLAFAFASPSAPYRLQTDRARLGNRFQPADYTRDFTSFTLAASAAAYVNVPAFGRVELGGGHFLYSHDPGYISFGGGLDTDFLGVLRITGGVSGQINLEDKRFNLHGRVSSCIADIPLLDNLCWGSVGHVSTIGAGACVEVGPFQVGGGLRFSPLEVFLWPLDGCKWSKFRDDNVARAARAAGRVIRTRRGDPSRAIELRGADGAPRVRVTTSDGTTLDSTDASGLAHNQRIRILRSERLKMTVVGLIDPAPGEHRIEPLPSSPAITASAQASDQPDAHVKARVTGRRSTRTLTYEIRSRDDQTVRFFEVGPGGERELGTATSGRGRLRFTPAPGAAGARSRRASISPAWPPRP